VAFHLKESEIGDLSDFERGQIFGVPVARACVTKNGAL
jgi:hypothetical protein